MLALDDTRTWNGRLLRVLVARGVPVICGERLPDCGEGQGVDSGSNRRRKNEAFDSGFQFGCRKDVLGALYGR